MGNCIICKHSNKSSGVMICNVTKRAVSTNDWCSHYEYPFSKETYKTERLEPKRYGYDINPRKKEM